jgi:tetratricopeptide (TPR) repeat protein
MLALLMATAGLGNAANYCGELKNHFGPFDFRERAKHAHDFELVEHAHFTSDVENGIKGNTGLIGGDIAYTLHVIPNHHRALAAMARYALRTKSVHLEGAKYPVECYFNRAIRMAPDDGAVRSEYGTYLSGLGRPEKAFAMYREAAELDPENATINYNLGLAYLKKKDYDQAAVYAHKAYGLGFPLPGLKNKLAEVGKWQEQVAQ